MALVVPRYKTSAFAHGQHCSRGRWREDSHCSATVEPAPDNGHSPQPIHCARSQSKQPVEDIQKPVLLDLQHECGVICEHVSRKDVNSGLPAIASIAALRDCMANLKDAAKMDSEAWFLVVREKIEEELDWGGFAELPTV